MRLRHVETRKFILIYEVLDLMFLVLTYIVQSDVSKVMKIMGVHIFAFNKVTFEMNY